VDESFTAIDMPIVEHMADVLSGKEDAAIFRQFCSHKDAKQVLQ
jgi:hypothetical protein